MAWPLHSYSFCICTSHQVRTWIIWTSQGAHLDNCTYPGVHLSTSTFSVAPCQVQTFAPGALRSHWTFWKHSMSSQYHPLPHLGNCTTHITYVVKSGGSMLWGGGTLKSQVLSGSSLSLLCNHIWILQTRDVNLCCITWCKVIQIFSISTYWERAGPACYSRQCPPQLDATITLKTPVFLHMVLHMQSQMYTEISEASNEEKNSPTNSFLSLFLSFSWGVEMTRQLMKARSTVLNSWKLLEIQKFKVQNTKTALRWPISWWRLMWPQMWPQMRPKRPQMWTKCGPDSNLSLRRDLTLHTANLRIVTATLLLLCNIYNICNICPPLQCDHSKDTEFKVRGLFGLWKILAKLLCVPRGVREKKKELIQKLIAASLSLVANISL